MQMFCNNLIKDPMILIVTFVTRRDDACPETAEVFAGFNVYAQACLLHDIGFPDERKGSNLD
jgi:hypothetical protein